MVTCKNCYAVFDDKNDAVVISNIRHLFMLFLLVTCLYFVFIALSRMASPWFWLFALPLGIWSCFMSVYLSMLHYRLRQ